jgi:CheY-like chemotaxis protein
MQRILVVDDEESLRHTYRLALTGAGYVVDEARHGGEALLIQDQQPAHAAVVDTFMPEKDGFETIVEFRQRYPKTKILAISGGDSFTKKDWLDVARILGAHATLRKPISENQLLLAIAELLADRTD